MQDRDQKLIWENYDKGVPVSKPKFTSKERDRLMGIDKDTPKPVSIEVKKEDRDGPSMDDFKMTEDEWLKAEQETGGVRLSKFVQQHDVDAEQPVAVHATYVQKHYGKIHAAQKGTVTGNSIADAIRGFGGGPLKNALDEEQRKSKGLIITKVETGGDAAAELDKKSRMNASMNKWYGNLDRGKTNYRGD